MNCPSYPLKLCAMTIASWCKRHDAWSWGWGCVWNNQSTISFRVWDLGIRVCGVQVIGNENRVRWRVGDRSADRRDERHINWGRKYRFPEYIRNWNKFTAVRLLSFFLGRFVATHFEKITHFEKKISKCVKFGTNLTQFDFFSKSVKSIHQHYFWCKL